MLSRHTISIGCEPREIGSRGGGARRAAVRVSPLTNARRRRIMHVRKIFRPERVILRRSTAACIICALIERCQANIFRFAFST